MPLVETKIPDFLEDRLTRQEAAEYLGFSPSTLAVDMTRSNLKIPCYKLGSRVWYRRSELDGWVKEHHCIHPDGVDDDLCGACDG